MDIYRSLLSCLGFTIGEGAISLNSHSNSNSYEKLSHTIAHDARTHDIDCLAAKFVHTFLSAPSHNSALKSELNRQFYSTGFLADLAAAILSQLTSALKVVANLTESMRTLLAKVAAAAVGFAKEHPVYTTILALGVLVSLAPWVLTALGFGELGPVAGSWAAAWQRLYAGYVPRGSLFSFFQRLGMVWK